MRHGLGPAELTRLGLIDAGEEAREVPPPAQAGQDTAELGGEIGLEVRAPEPEPHVRRLPDEEKPAQAPLAPVAGHERGQVPEQRARAREGLTLVSGQRHVELEPTAARGGAVHGAPSVDQPVRSALIRI